MTSISQRMIYFVFLQFFLIFSHFHFKANLKYYLAFILSNFIYIPQCDLFTWQFLFYFLINITKFIKIHPLLLTCLYCNSYFSFHLGQKNILLIWNYISSYFICSRYPATLCHFGIIILF